MTALERTVLSLVRQWAAAVMEVESHMGAPTDARWRAQERRDMAIEALLANAKRLPQPKEGT